MVAQIITYIGNTGDYTLMENQFKHPTTGDVLTFEPNRPMALNPEAVPEGPERDFYAAILEKVTSDSRWRVIPANNVPESMAVVKAPMPVGAGASSVPGEERPVEKPPIIGTLPTEPEIEPLAGKRKKGDK